MNGNKPLISKMGRLKDDPDCLEHPATGGGGDERLDKGAIAVTGFILLFMTLFLENYLMIRRGFRIDTWIYLPELWILSITFVLFIIGSGVICHFYIEWLKNGWLKFLIKERNIPPVVLDFTIGMIGFSLACFILPFWLSLREGTIDCMTEQNCTNSFSTHYVYTVDTLCYTSHFKKKSPGLDICEAIGYTLPIILFTSIPVIFGINYCCRQGVKLHPSLVESSIQDENESDDNNGGGSDSESILNQQLFDF